MEGFDICGHCKRPIIESRVCNCTVTRTGSSPVDNQVMPGRDKVDGTGWRRAECELPQKNKRYLAKWVDTKTRHTWIEWSTFNVQAEKGVGKHLSIDGHWASHWENDSKKVTWWIEIVEPPEA